jgi:hypothetical protein
MKIDQSTTVPSLGRERGLLTGFLRLAQRHPLVDPPVLRRRLRSRHGRSRSPLTTDSTGLAPRNGKDDRSTEPEVFEKAPARGEGSSGSSLTDTPEGPPHNILNS